MKSTFYATVIPLIKDRTVLDVGSIGHSYSGREGYKTWNFAVLRQHAASIRGFDLASLASDVEQARLDGFDIEIGDAETFRVQNPVDIVFAGDLIEHLSNPGKFMDCAYENLSVDGQLILSTPNTFSFAKLARVVARRTNEPPVNPEHTFYFTPQTLSHLASRHGFKIREVKYCGLDYAPDHGTRVKRAQLRINTALSRAVPRFSQTMVLVFDKTPKPAIATAA